MRPFEVTQAEKHFVVRLQGSLQGENFRDLEELLKPAFAAKPVTLLVDAHG